MDPEVDKIRLLTLAWKAVSHTPLSLDEMSELEAMIAKHPVLKNDLFLLTSEFEAAESARPIELALRIICRRATESDQEEIKTLKNQRNRRRMDYEEAILVFKELASWPSNKPSPSMNSTVRTKVFQEISRLKKSP
jgi:hypothetical protein